MSERFPYLPLQIRFGGRTVDVEALMDSGFNGDVALPSALIGDAQPPDDYRSWILADGAVGRGVTDNYLVLLDHGRRLIVEP